MLNDGTGFKKVYIATGFTDLRRGIDGLARIIRFQFHLDPYDKHTLFLFCGRRTDRIKGLLWEGDGFLLLYKRIENGNFRWPRTKDEALEITADQYQMLMQGLEIIARAVKYTEEQLNTVDKSFLIHLLLQQEQLEALTKELHASNEKMQLLMEQVILGKQNRFGRSSEKMDDTNQISFREVDGSIVFFNEAEAVSDLSVSEPEDLEPRSSKQPKRKGKKEADLSGLPIRRIDHYLSETELEEEFGEKGWKQLPDAISRKYRFVPAKVEVEEHHIGVYASKTDEHMVKADHPKSLLHGSLVSPSLAAAIINGKYVNAVPLYRLEQEFQRYGLQITRQHMANWCIRLGEEYLSVLYDHLHEELYSCHVIQADETPVLVNHDGRKAGSKSWMWVYRSGHLYHNRQIVLYEYQQTRNASHPREFLKGYDGICVTDGYQVCHTLEKELEELTIAGCWVHCRRRFDEALKLIRISHQKESEAFLLMKQIQAIYREEKLADDRYHQWSQGFRDHL